MRSNSLPLTIHYSLVPPELSWFIACRQPWSRWNYSILVCAPIWISASSACIIWATLLGQNSIDTRHKLELAASSRYAATPASNVLEVREGGTVPPSLLTPDWLYDVALPVPMTHLIENAIEVRDRRLIATELVQLDLHLEAPSCPPDTTLIAQDELLRHRLGHSGLSLSSYQKVATGCHACQGY